MVRNAYAEVTLLPVPRVKEFDPEDALERAMGLFWSEGYEGTTLSRLLDHMGIQRQSLYDTFTDKRTLYLMVLERYRRQMMVLIDEHLAPEGASLPAVHGFFQYYLAEVLRTEQRSCMMANAALELALRDEEVARVVREYLEALELALRNALQRARRSGELPPEANPIALARHLVSCLMGMSVMSRGAGLSRPALRQLVASALASIA
jgi:TetR/AcrR family transcriptional repressor of nem operon